MFFLDAGVAWGVRRASGALAWRRIFTPSQRPPHYMQGLAAPSQMPSAGVSALAEGRGCGPRTRPRGAILQGRTHMRLFRPKCGGRCWPMGHLPCWWQSLWPSRWTSCRSGGARAPLERPPFAVALFGRSSRPARAPRERRSVAGRAMRGRRWCVGTASARNSPSFARPQARSGISPPIHTHVPTTAAACARTWVRFVVHDVESPKMGVPAHTGRPPGFASFSAPPLTTQRPFHGLVSFYGRLRALRRPSGSWRCHGLRRGHGMWMPQVLQRRDGLRRSHGSRACSGQGVRASVPAAFPGALRVYLRRRGRKWIGRTIAPRGLRRPQ